MVTCGVLALATTFAAAKGPPDLTGAYAIKTGAMPNKAKYVGKVALAKGAAALTYKVSWATGAEGQTSASGIALQWDKFVAAGFGGDAHNAGVYDPANCDMNGDTNFLCASTANGDEKVAGGVGSHMIVPDPKTRFVGTFDVQPWDGDTTLKTVTIAKAKGTVYTLTWTFEDGRTLSGVGILADNKKLYWAAGTGAFGLALYKINGAALDGQWVMNGSTDLGVEKLKK
jgi:hypothetical protein